MNKERLTAFSDGVIAVIITIMVLEMKVPHDSGLAALWLLAPAFGSYVLSFVYVGIYWNNHHHLLHAVRSIDGLILWANLHLLFWLSLIPFCSGWMGENHFETLRALWDGALYVRHCVLHPLAAADCTRRSRVELGDRVRQRPQGDRVAAPLHRGHPAGLL